MKFDRRFFKIEDQWNVVHLPERPNGFAILVIGDRNHYVDENVSLWIQNPDRFQMIEDLRGNGYTIFYSNLYGRHWGSPRAVQLLKQLYQNIIRNEIINTKIHVLAEGMGGLAALKLMNEMEPSVRSIAMLNPCLDLKAYFYIEKKNKLFYKRLLKELAMAYQIESKWIEKELIQPFALCKYISTVPVKIWHATNRVPYEASDHSRMFEKMRNDQGAPIELSFHLFEKRFQISTNLLVHFKKYEQIL